MRINGFAEEIRKLGGIKFIKLHTVSGDIQVTLPKEKVPKDVFDLVDKITRQSALTVTGKTRRNEEAPGGKELIPRRIEIVSLAETPLPLEPSEKTPAELETRLDWRFLDLRTEKRLAVFRVQNEIIRSFREYLIKNGFFEIQPPCIIASASEGGANLFKIPYFEKEAYLAQSPQLYKQMCAISLEKVFMIIPVWRAEKFNKPTHLNEIRQLDIEMSFVQSEEDVMRVLENVFVHILKSVKKNCKKELKLLNREIKIPKLPLKRVTYTQAVERLKKQGEEIEWGDDFSKSQEEKLSKMFGDAFFIKDWPTMAKTFYTMPNEKDDKICHAFDLIHNGLEIASGTQRIHVPDLLIKQIKKFGMDPENFKYYIDCFRFGAAPHAGWSFGLERITMTITGMKNIRECCMFPRDRNRLTP
ncbi:MAG: aspartate--tRNA(Asn) ligase [Candidatus Aenigmarchaeota archaeon]|nr:aspartate--tRNA(Asn) ligase [Candidatus Aenigmarchaeota archaeon]